MLLGVVPCCKTRGQPGVLRRWASCPMGLGAGLWDLGMEGEGTLTCVQVCEGHV